MELSLVIESLKGAIATFKTSGFNLSSLKALISTVVKAVEEFDTELFKGKDKKEAVLDLLEQIYTYAKIDIPFIPNSIELKILRWVASILIDIAVKRFNKEGW